MTASAEAQQLGHLVADFEDDGEEPEGDDRHRIARLLSSISDAELEDLRERTAAVVSVEPDDLDAWREIGADPVQAADDLETLIDQYDGDNREDLAADDLFDIGRLLGQADAEAFDAMRDRAALLLDCEPNEVERHREREQYRQQYGPILAEDGKTWLIRGVPLRRREVLNFELTIEAILKTDSRELIEAVREQNGTGDSIQFEPRDLKKRQRFEDTVLGNRVALNLEVPDGEHPKDLLNRLNEWIGRLDVPVRQGTHHVGLHGDEVVFPDGTLGPDGWKDDPTTVHINRDVAFERAVSLSPGSDEFDADDVAEILRTLPWTRDPSRFLAVIGWFYAAPLRPYIFDWGSGKFNHLSITGDTGSGKTTTLRYLWRCFGVDSDPLGIDDTAHARLTAFSASNGVPMWFDEYKPSGYSERELKNFHNDYRAAALGKVVPKGKPDGRTVEWEFKAPVVLSGEEQIRPPAERRRSIMVEFSKAVTADGTDTAIDFKKLAGEGRMEDGELILPPDAPEPEHHALAYYRWLAGADEADLRAKWQDARELVWQYRQGWPFDVDLDDLEMHGLQLVTFGWMVLRAFAREHGVERGELPGEDDLDATLQHVAREVGPEGKRKSHLDRFVVLLGNAAATGYVEDGTHYTLVHEGKPAEEVRIKVDRAHHALSRYVRDHDLDTEDLLGDADDYKRRFKKAAEADEGYVTAWQKNTPPLARCAGISTIRAMNDLDFNRRDFSPESLESGEKAEGKSDDGDDGSDEDIESDKQRAMKFIREREAGQRVEANPISMNQDIPPGAVDNAIETLKQRGELQPASDGDGYILIGRS